MPGAARPTRATSEATSAARKTAAWPAGEHGIFVDHNDFVYIAGNGSGSGAFPWDADHGDDAHVLKFTADGTHVLTVGEPGPTEDEVPDSNDTSGA